LNALPRPALPQTATSISHITLDTRTLGLRREFTSSALRLKSRPPEKDIVEEEVEEETKRKEEAKEKEHGEAESKLDSSGKRSRESFGKPGEILKGGASAGGGAAGGSGSSSGNGGNGSKKSASLNRSLQKPMVPDIYPQVMALPIAKRPLFPGFYKAVTIKDPNVAAAIQEMMKRGQPYIGAFLFKDEDADGDTIESLDEVHDVGVFAQVTSAFPVHGEEGALTAVLYPHRRIRITGLQPRDGGAAEAKEEEPISEAEIEEVTEEYEERRDKGDIVASFEEPTETPERRPRAGEYATSFLKKYNVSVVDVENLVEEPHDKKEPVIRAVTSEIVNVFKEIANLNPLFRDQISTFSISHSTGNVIDEPAKLADFAAAVASGEVKELQEVLESLSVEERLQKALVVLKKELMNAQLQSKISKDVEAKIQKRQREYWLMEQMKGIKRELGIESDGKDKLVEKFKEKAEKLAMPEAVKKVFDEVRNCFIVLSRGPVLIHCCRN
jgi:Lon-like ATP-dependent protease